MGWFDGKKIHAVATSLSRVVEDDSIPDTAKVSVLTAIFRNESIAQHLVDSRLNGTSSKIRRMLRYAEVHNTSALPNSLIVTNTTGRWEVKAVIESIEGKPVTLDYFKLGPLNNTHLAWQKLVDEYGYDQETNELTGLTSSKGMPVYLKDIVSIYPEDTVIEAGALEALGYPETWGYTPERKGGKPGQYARHTDFVLSGGQNGAEVTYVYEIQEEVKAAVITDGVETAPAVTKRVVKENTLVWSFEEDAEEDYFHVKYHYTDAGNKVTKYWTYRKDQGTHPTLDAMVEANFEAVSKYMPVVFFNSQRTNVTTDEYADTDQYKANEKMLDYISIDYRGMADSINDNPDADKIEQAVLAYGVPITSSHPIDLEYLYMFFEDLYFRNPSTTTGKTDNGATGSALVLQTRDLKYVLSYGKLTKQIRGGRVSPGAKNGEIVSGIAYEDYTKQYTRRTYVGEGEYNTETVVAPGKYYYRYFRRQLTPTFYEEVRVYGLRAKFRIYRSYDSVGGVEDDETLIFIDQNIMDKFKSRNKEELYLRSMHVIINTRVTQKVEFYESDVFTTLLKVAAIAFVIHSGGKSLALLAAAATISVTAVLIVLAVMAFQYIILPYLFTVVVKEIGMEKALILAIAITVYRISTGKGVVGVPGNPFATDLMSVSSGLTNGIQTELERLFNNYQSDVEAFNLLADEATLELEAAKDLLGMDSVIDPFEFIGREPIIITGETPDDFYNRTIHTQNIGTLAITAISNFVETSLKLPDFNDTMGAGK